MIRASGVGTSTAQEHRRRGALGYAFLGVAVLSMLVLGLVGGRHSAAAETTGAVNARSVTSGLGDGEVRVRFAASEYRLRRWQVLYNTDPPNAFEFAPAAKVFAQIEVSSRGEAESVLRFAVEGQPDRANNQVCASPTACYDTLVGVSNGKFPGRLYLYSEVRLGHGSWAPMYDFSPQAIELSAQDQSLNLAVFREVLIVPPQGSPADCDDYSDWDRLRYTCLIMHEVLPDDAPVTTDALRNALPALVKPADQYSLVFAEEFNSATPRTDLVCVNGISALDSDVWNRTLPCGAADTNGDWCVDVNDGHLTISQFYGCGLSLTSDGAFSYKYGYMEVKFKLSFESIARYNNYNVMLGNAWGRLNGTYYRYGIDPDSYEDIGKYIGNVIGIEYIPNTSYLFTQTWLNHDRLGDGVRLPMRFSRREMRVCVDTGTGEMRLGASFCGLRGTQVTIILGVEWTPRGYRYFLKSEGLHSEMIAYPTDLQRLVRVRHRIKRVV